MKVHVTGISGTGKSSIVRALKARKYMAVDIDDDLGDWINKDTNQKVEWEPGRSDAWYEIHGWTCDLAGLKELLADNENIVVAGAAVNQNEYLHLFDKIYYLRGNIETLAARIQNRTDNDFGKHPTEQARMLQWQEQYDNEMDSMGAITLDASRPLEEIVDIIASNFR